MGICTAERSVTRKWATGSAEIMPQIQLAVLEPVGNADYRVLLELGRGGMGTVYLARELGLGGFERLVALKRMREYLVTNEEFVHRFAQEARLAANVRHANTVSIDRFGRDEHGLYLVLDYVEGASLDQLLKKCVEQQVRLPPQIVLRIIADAACGLHAVHEALDARGRPLSILHRDVCSQNILVGSDGTARLGDFGIAKSGFALHRTQPHRLLGKSVYMAPEYLRQDPIDRRIDIYSMGMTLWVALAGIEPWGEETGDARETYVTKGALPSLGSIGLRVAPEVEAIVQRACASDPGERFETAAEMAAELEVLARASGWVTSHGEVAECVEQLFGRELAARRDAVAQCVLELDARLSSSPPPYRSTPSGGTRIGMGAPRDTAKLSAPSHARPSAPMVTERIPLTARQNPPLPRRLPAAGARPGVTPLARGSETLGQRVLRHKWALLGLVLVASAADVLLAASVSTALRARLFGASDPTVVRSSI